MRDTGCGIPFPASRAPRISHSASRSAFTLLELLVALSILVTAFVIIWSTFSAGVNAWQRGGDLLDGLRHGDFVAEQLVSALRSAAFFSTAPDKYGFRLENGSLLYPADKISWVTSSTAFIPPDSPYGKGLHRLVFTIENNDDGNPAVAIRAMPHLLDEEDAEDFDMTPWFVSSEIKGFKCRVYNFEEETWQTEWEDTNSIPRLVEITLYMDPVEEFGPPVTMQRLVEIPVAPASTNAVKMDETGGSEDNSGRADGAGTGSAAPVRDSRGTKPGTDAEGSVRVGPQK